MNEILLAALLGIGGALTRFLITSLKTLQLKQKIRISSLLIYGVSLLFIGAFSGIVLSFGKALSFLGGYAGLDLLDGFYKTFKNKKIKIK